jgi:DHA1 family inner membrane transport protein
VIERGPGLGAIPWFAALLTGGGLAIVLWSVRLEMKRDTASALQACALTD